MVTGASTADLSIVLVDARKGVSEQTRRHAYIASLLRIPHLVVASTRWTSSTTPRSVFDEIVAELTDWAARLAAPRHHLHPDLGAAGRQRRRPLGRHAVVRRARRCSTTSSTS